MAKQVIKKLDFKFEGKREAAPTSTTEGLEARLHGFYKETVVPAMMKKFNYSSVMQVPKLNKITINVGVGLAVSDSKHLQSAINELELISGQRPYVTRAKKSIANFKLRAGQPLGCFVTLRRARMYEFLDRFINVTSPRIRDFKGFSDKSFDGRGNYNVGIKEQIIFLEIDVDKVARINGMDINFVTSARTDEEAYALLTEFGFPFRKRD